MQPCKTGDQPYSDASPNSECSLPCHLNDCESVVNHHVTKGNTRLTSLDSAKQINL